MKTLIQKLLILLGIGWKVYSFEEMYNNECLYITGPNKASIYKYLQELENQDVISIDPWSKEDNEDYLIEEENLIYFSKDNNVGFIIIDFCNND